MHQTGLQLVKKLIRGVPFWELARAADFAVREWVEKGAVKFQRNGSA